MDATGINTATRSVTSLFERDVTFEGTFVSINKVGRADGRAVSMIFEIGAGDGASVSCVAMTVGMWEGEFVGGGVMEGSSVGFATGSRATGAGDVGGTLMEFNQVGDADGDGVLGTIEMICPLATSVDLPFRPY